MKSTYPGKWTEFPNLSKAEIQTKIAEHEFSHISNPFPRELLPTPLRNAAVLIPFIRSNHEWHLLFIRRTTVDGDMHSGQVAFPGGGAENGDLTPENTALRETQEELGITPDQVQIVGQLGKLTTISNYLITPIVGFLDWPIPLNPATTEVSKVFTIPLRWLANSENYTIKNRSLPEPHAPIPVIYFHKYKGELLWGASAKLTLHLLEVLELK
jgi:8-oxo-dGTP pyrophosphatase MutT (NUDIX family)